MVDEGKTCRTGYWLFLLKHIIVKKKEKKTMRETKEMHLS